MPILGRMCQQKRGDNSPRPSWHPRSPGTAGRLELRRERLVSTAEGEAINPTAVGGEKKSRRGSWNIFSWIGTRHSEHENCEPDGSSFILFSEKKKKCFSHSRTAWECFLLPQFVSNKYYILPYEFRTLPVHLTFKRNIKRSYKTYWSVLQFCASESTSFPS